MAKIVVVGRGDIVGLWRRAHLEARALTGDKHRIVSLFSVKEFLHRQQETKAVDLLIVNASIGQLASFCSSLRSPTLFGGAYQHTPILVTSYSMNVPEPKSLGVEAAVYLSAKRRVWPPHLTEKGRTALLTVVDALIPRG